MPEEVKKDILDKNIENFQYATWLIKVIAIIVGIMMFIYSRNAFIFFIAAMFPSIIALFVDRAKHKCLSATICTFNLIGMSRYLNLLVSSSSVDATAKSLIVDVSSWFIIYITTLVGLGVYIGFPALVASFYIWKSNNKIKSLEKKRDIIAKEWNIKIDR